MILEQIVLNKSQIFKKALVRALGIDKTIPFEKDFLNEFNCDLLIIPFDRTNPLNDLLYMYY